MMEFSLTYLSMLLSLNPNVVFSRFAGDLTKQTAPTIDIPDGLLFGAGTSAFQVEGALKTNGRSESSIERLLAQAYLPGHNATPESAEISSDSYHRYKEDVKVLKYIGLNFYRFSMSWARLLPTGYANDVNQEGVDYYHALLDELEQAGIEPMVQLHHFDHPAVLDDFGGWQNDTMVELFKDYSRFIFKEYGHRIKYFLTFNEPNILCNLLESGLLSEEKVSTFPRIYVCSHNLLKAHAEAYHLYHDEFNPDKTGMISINILCNDYIVEKEKDLHLIDVAFAFGCGWFANPIFSETGDYSDILKQRVIETNSLREHAHLQLPTFSEAWVDKIRGTADFFGLSYYSTRLVESTPGNDFESSINFLLPPEARLVLKYVSTWIPTPNYNYIVPSGLKTALKEVKRRYNNPPVHIIESGYSDDGRLNDTDRIKFIYAHVKQIIDAINHDQCDVKSYIYWSLIDNFEFWDGYSSRFGLAHIDFNSPNRTRTLKKSATWLHDALLRRQLYID